MDIRSFFGGKTNSSRRESTKPSPLPNERKPPASVTSQSEVKRRSQRLDTSANKKAQSSRKAVTPILQLSDDDVSEGESPIPSSLRKVARKQKRTRNTVLSDSDEDISPKKLSKHREKSITPSPVKANPQKKRSRLVVYDSDEQGSSPTKQTTKAKKPKPVVESESDQSMTTETDSENEFAEKKKPKKKDSLPIGQKRLDSYKARFDGNARKAPVKDGKADRKIGACQCDGILRKQRFS
ncbi:hypothetical protein KIN20_019374 [Parelaphostrongylus tenuis]|uniref:Uncharacterized protein n=1 Tax=Parelaphostrongylus tenuis TaxID=148309 RepID=A0AAD5MPG3_PARTN|nr:hypothetical protein KIN20_019374 [Parelaphostrongylus tenuis]